MSTDPVYDRVITLEQPAALEPVPPETFETQATPSAPPAPAAVESRQRTRPRWVVPAAIAAVGLIASGTLGYLFYSTNTKLNATQQRLAATQTTLASTQQQLTSAQADAASKKVVADYVSMYTADAGTVRIDYGQVIACSDYSSCRTAAQQTLDDMKAFQSDRQAKLVPPALSASDGQLGDSLSAGIAALQELISGMDHGQVAKVKEGFSKLDDSMLSMAKAESALGTELR